jgi:predicted acylesterase/phospholipase RssA
MDHINRRSALIMAAAGAGLSSATTATGAADRETLNQPGSPPKYLILACDGGGIRGYLTALIVERLNKEVPFIDRVNLFAGTSTGSILAVGLAHGVTPEDLVKLYRDEGDKIFDRIRPRPEPSGRIGKLWEVVRDHAPDIHKHLGFHFKDLLRTRYPKDGLERALTQAFGAATFRDLKPGKAAIVTTLRLSSDQKSWVPLVLHNLDVPDAASNAHVADGPTLDTRLVDAVLCSTAAPLYFPPHKHPEFGYCVDGGLFANCPASIALALADRANKKKDVAVRALSIGTGAQFNHIVIPSSPFDLPEEYGALAWLSPLARARDHKGEDRTPAFPLVSALFDASSASHDYVCKQALGDDYHRVQVYLTEAIPLDATDSVAMKRIEQAAAGLFESPDWQKTREWLRAQLS